MENSSPSRMQPGSSRSTRRSPSLSIPSAQFALSPGSGWRIRRRLRSRLGRRLGRRARCRVRRRLGRRARCRDRRRLGCRDRGWGRRDHRRLAGCDRGRRPGGRRGDGAGTRDRRGREGSWPRWGPGCVIGRRPGWWDPEPGCVWRGGGRGHGGRGPSREDFAARGRVCRAAERSVGSRPFGGRDVQRSPTYRWLRPSFGPDPGIEGRSSPSRMRP